MFPHQRQAIVAFLYYVLDEMNATSAEGISGYGSQSSMNFWTDRTSQKFFFFARDGEMTELYPWRRGGFLQQRRSWLSSSRTAKCNSCGFSPKQGAHIREHLSCKGAQAKKWWRIGRIAECRVCGFLPKEEAPQQQQEHSRPTPTSPSHAVSAPVR